MDESHHSTIAVEPDPQGLGSLLGLTSAELAALVGVAETHLFARPLAPDVEHMCGELALILTRAIRISGGEAQALQWFKHQPLVSLGTKTPMEHCRDGHAAWVLAHIEDVLNYVYN